MISNPNEPVGVSGDPPHYATEVIDLEYHRHGGAPLLARVYRPLGPGPFPAMVDVHGGAWTSGTRLQNAVICEALAAAGIVVAALDFRMPPEARYPASVADVNWGIRWLKANASRFRGRSDLVGGIGSSSGAHQLLLAALRPHDERYRAFADPGESSAEATLDFIVTCWPVADPLQRYRMAQRQGAEILLRNHGAYWPDEQAMEDGNPQRIVERGETRRLPPLLVLQGTRDDNLPPDMAARFAAAWRQAGGLAQLEEFEGQPHAFITKDPASAASTRALDLIKSFVARQVAAIA